MSRLLLATNNMEVPSSSSDHFSTRSGLIPELSLGLSLSNTTTSTLTVGHLVNNGLEHGPPSLLLCPPLEDTPRKDVASLAQDFPGVNKVLQEMACFIKSSRNTVPSTVTNPSTGHLPLLFTCQYPPTPAAVHQPPASPSHAQPLYLPDIPIKPFVPQLVNPQKILKTVNPPLLLASDPLTKKGELKLLLLPQEQPEINRHFFNNDNNDGHVTMATNQLQKRRIRRYSYKENRRRATPTKNSQSRNSSFQSQAINNCPPQSNTHQNSISQSRSPVTTPDPPVINPDPPLTTAGPLPPPIATPSITPDSLTPDHRISPTPDPPTAHPDTPTLTPDPLTPSPNSSITTPNHPIITPDPPIITPDPPISHPSPLTHQSVAIQVNPPTMILSEHSTDDSISSNHYLMVTDIEDDESHETITEEGSCCHEGYNNESIDCDGLLDNNDNDFMSKFKYLEEQLLLIENESSDIKQELTHSRKV